MKVLIVGAGGVGGPCASILSRNRAVREIRLADISLERAEKVRRRIGSPIISAHRVDASDIPAVKALAGGTDILVDLVTPLYFLSLLEAAAQAGVHYLNTAWEETIYEGYQTRGVHLNSRCRYDEDFKNNGRTALLGCGMSSGYATNVVARYYADRLDVVESIRFRLGKKDLSLSREQELITPWNPGWNPRQALLDFVASSVVFRDGQFIEIPQPFSGIEMWEFPEPLGRMAVSHHAHEEPFSIPHAFAARGLRYCDFKYYVNMQVAPLVALGFGSEEKIPVGETRVSPLELLLELIPAPADAFLNEDPARFGELDRTAHTSIMTEIIGKEGGKRVKYLVTVPTINTPRQIMFELYGTSLVNVALPAAVGVVMTVEGAKTGVIHPHDLDPLRFLEIMKNTGYPNRWLEQKEILG